MSAVYLKMNPKKWLRSWTANFLYISGVLPFWAKIKFRNKAVVLMYHRVVSDNEPYGDSYQVGITVSVNTFKRQMEYIRTHFKPVTLEKFTDHLQRNVPFESKTILITFDDGWKDNFVNAYPVLKENKIPATIFITTDFIGSTDRFWQQELSELLSVIRNKALENEGWWQLRADAFEQSVDLVITSSEKDFPGALTNLLNSQKKKTIVQIEGLMQSLGQACQDDKNVSDGPDTFLSWKEARTMAKDGIAFGSHGKSHVLLPVISVQEAEQEIAESKNQAEKQLGQPINAISYPNGDYNDAILRIVKQQGYAVAFVTAAGLVSAGDDPYTIRRINIHNDMTNTLPMFLARATGLW